MGLGINEVARDPNALVEIKDGDVTCWSGTQKSHFLQQGLALTLNVPLDKVRVIWATGPGSYGRNDADDCAMDAAILAKAVGKPVRLMRGPQRSGVHAHSARGARHRWQSDRL